MQKLSVFPALPEFTQTALLGDRSFRVRLRWFDRLDAWYLDLYEADGTPIALGRRVSPGWLAVPDVNRKRADLPAGGALFVLGDEPYVREDLGDGVQILFVSADDFATLHDDDVPGVPVVVTI